MHPKTLAYVLEDFLEVKTQIAPEKADAIKRLLSFEKLRAFDIHSVEGFSLDQNLVLFRPDSPNSFKQLIFLNPVSGVTQALPLS